MGIPDDAWIETKSMGSYISQSSNPVTEVSLNSPSSRHGSDNVDWNRTAHTDTYLRSLQPVRGAIRSVWLAPVDYDSIVQTAGEFTEVTVGPEHLSWRTDVPANII
jgi:hypothetical protein